MIRRPILTTIVAALGWFHASTVRAQSAPETSGVPGHFQQLDKNRDGRLSADEAGDLAFFEAGDNDGDGFVIVKPVDVPEADSPIQTPGFIASETLGPMQQP